MNMREYQAKASRTINNNISDAETIESGALGLGGEAGKLCCIVNTERFKGIECIEERKGEIADIVGDALWFLASIATSIDISLEEIAQRNIEKTEKTYLRRIRERGFE